MIFKKFRFAVHCAVVFASVHAQAGESQELAVKAAAAHCKDAACSQRLTSLLINTPAITRNIGTEDRNAIAGPGNSWHPASRAACDAKILRTGVVAQNPAFESKCGAKWMAPVPSRNRDPISAKVCIDQFEFPNLPCEYPVAWTSVSQANRICQSMGKRLCNAFEWEGGCAGSIDMTAPYVSQGAEHNAAREKTWAFSWRTHGADSRSVCAVFSPNDPEIDARARGHYSAIGTSVSCNPAVSPLATCGTNSWPAGFKAACGSPLGVFDMHGNLAEVVSLPTGPNDVADASGRVGVNEHKGSFFVYRGGYPDDCRVRQPAEHQFPISRDTGHAFYQEGFRCCKDVQ